MPPRALEGVWVWVWSVPGGCRGAVGVKLPHQELGDGREAVAHAINVPALGAQDAGEGVREALDLQQQDVVKGVLHAGQLVHQIQQGRSGSLLGSVRR